MNLSYEELAEMRVAQERARLQDEHATRHREEHDGDCERCLACRIEAATHAPPKPEGE